MDNPSRDDAIFRLVQAIRPNQSEEEESSSVDLAKRLIDSQLGGGAPLEASSRQFASTWQRRIRNYGGASQEEVERLYQDLTSACDESGEQQLEDLPAQIMTVLTKCIGKHVGSAQPAPTSTARTRHQPTRKKPPPAPTIPTERMEVDSQPSPPMTHDQMIEAIRHEEQEVLRELFWALQGIDGDRIKFFVKEEHPDLPEDNEDTYEGIRVSSPAVAPNMYQRYGYYNSRLGSGAMDVLRVCGEAGWLYRRIQKYVDFHLHNNKLQRPDPSRGGGQMCRALARSVYWELQSYHNLLRSWEPHLSEWSLRQWYIQLYTHDVIYRLTILAVLTECLPSGMEGPGSRRAGGGIVLSALYKHTLHGDTRHKSLVESILGPTSQPWFRMLYLWTTQGLLPKSWGDDFFITLQPDYVDRQNDNTSNRAVDDNKYLWHDKYTLDKKQIPHPGIFDPELVKPAFVVGKGINFIRTCLNQIGWTLQLDSKTSEEDETAAVPTAAGGRFFHQKSSDKQTDAEEASSDDSEEAIMQRLGYHYVAEPIGMDINPQLTQTLLRAERLVHSHILQSLRKDHNLLDHLYALKQFLFHGQGDFFSSLLEGLYSEFGCGSRESNSEMSFVTGQAVGGVYPQQLLAIMETSLRQTNAKDLPEFCLELLKVEMLPFQPKDEPDEPDADRSMGRGLFFSSPSRGGNDINDHDSERSEDNRTTHEDNRTVWDIFMLDYTVPDPLIPIVHEAAMDQYKLVYSFLFGLRKVEYMLNQTWRQSATLQHALQMMAQNNGLQTSSSPGYASATKLLRTISMTRQAMTHFCVNVKSYAMLEVVEGGWRELLERLEDAHTLDEAIHLHDCYLEGICRKTLLLKGKRTRSSASHRISRNNSSNKFRDLFGVLLSTSTEFCILQERLFDEALEAAERVAQRRREAEQRMTHGQWGFENDEDLAEEESFFGLAYSNELPEIDRLSQRFQQGMQSFLEALDAKVNGRHMSTSVDINDEDDLSEEETQDPGDRLYYATISGEEQDIDSLRFLAHQLDHNHYYNKLLRK